MNVEAWTPYRYIGQMRGPAHIPRGRDSFGVQFFCGARAPLGSVSTCSRTVTICRGCERALSAATVGAPC